MKLEGKSITCVDDLKEVSNAGLALLHRQAMIDIEREAKINRNSDAHAEAFAALWLIRDESMRRVTQ